MSAENPHRNNSGILFKNRKRNSEKAPDMTGECTINGQRFYVSSWTKQGQQGDFRTLAFNPADGKEQSECK